MVPGGKLKRLARSKVWQKAGGVCAESVELVAVGFGRPTAACAASSVSAAHVLSRVTLYALICN